MKAGITKCPKCHGWTHCLDGDWVEPHFPRGKNRVCAGSSRRNGGPVFTEEEFAAWAKSMRKAGHSVEEVRDASGPPPSQAAAKEVGPSGPPVSPKGEPA